MRAVEKSTITNVTDGIRTNLFHSMVWFEDEPSRSWWTCNTQIESHENERDLEIVQEWDYTVGEELKELIGTTYTNKIHLLCGNLSLKNFIVKHA